MATPLRPLVVLEDGVIATMASQAKFLTEFPFLKNLLVALEPSSCSSCGSGTDKRRDAYAAMKMSIAGLGSSQMLKLKTMLNAKQVRLNYRDASGRGIKLTF